MTRPPGGEEGGDPGRGRLPGTPAGSRPGPPPAERAQRARPGAAGRWTRAVGKAAAVAENPHESH